MTTGCSEMEGTGGAFEANSRLISSRTIGGTCSALSRRPASARECLSRQCTRWRATVLGGTGTSVLARDGRSAAAIAAAVGSWFASVAKLVHTRRMCCSHWPMVTLSRWGATARMAACVMLSWLLRYSGPVVVTFACRDELQYVSWVYCCVLFARTYVLDGMVCVWCSVPLLRQLCFQLPCGGVDQP